MTTKEFDAYFQALANWEGVVDYLYCDTIGLVTVGIGNMVKSAEDMDNLCMDVNDLPASREQKREAWGIVKKAYRPGKGHAFYRPLTRLRMPVDEIRKLLSHRLENGFLPGIAKEIPEFPSFPIQAKLALVDIAYNCGLGGFRKFVHLIKACNRKDFTTAALVCHRKTSRVSRNDWTAQLFLEASRVA